MITQLISKNASNQPANNAIISPVSGGNIIDTSGGLIVFSTTAFNFIPDGNGVEDIYLYNKTTNNFINLTALKADGTPTTLGSSNPSISGNGTRIVFESLEPNLATIPASPGSDIFLVENFSNTPPTFTLLTAGYNATSFNPFISRNGNWVVFETLASTQGPAALTNPADGFDGDRDIILVNVSNPANTKWVSQKTNLGGNSGNFASTNASVSNDGRYVVFQSNANNLIPTITDGNGTTDIFLFDSQNNTLTLVSKKINSVAPVTTANSTSINPIISADGRYIAYESFASDLVTVDTNGRKDIFVYDIQLNTNKLISLRPSGVQTTADSRNASISDNGEFIAFESDDVSLVANDNNNLTDIFVWNNNTISLFSADSAGNEGNNASTTPSISPNGQEVTFISNATNLDTSVPGQNGVTQQLFLASATPPPTISISNVTVNENDGTATLIVSLSSAGINPITVDYNTANGTATSGNDYQAIPNTTLTFNAGELQKQIIITIVNDTVIEPQESFTVDLSNAVGATIVSGGDKGTITINDDDTPGNNPPSAVSLTNPISGLPENTPVGTGIKVGDITITDDALGTNNLSLTGADAGSFSINGLELFYTGASPDFETKNQYNVTVNVDDTTVGATPDASTNFTLNITNIPDTSDELLTTTFSRFQNKDRIGTYLFAGPQETQSILQNFPNFQLEGTAFKAAVQANDDLIRFNRFQNTSVPGTYLFAGETESQGIRQNFPNFKEEGIAFYAYDGNASKGVDFFRFQNTQQPGTYIFVGQQERDSILANFPQFQLEGVAFEVAV